MLWKVEIFALKLCIRWLEGLRDKCRWHFFFFQEFNRSHRKWARSIERDLLWLTESWFLLNFAIVSFKLLYGDSEGKKWDKTQKPRGKWLDVLGEALGRKGPEEDRTLREIE